MSNQEEDKLSINRKRTIKERLKEEITQKISQLPIEIADENSRGNSLLHHRTNADVTCSYAIKCVR